MHCLRRGKRGGSRKGPRRTSLGRRRKALETEARREDGGARKARHSRRRLGIREGGTPSRVTGSPAGRPSAPSAKKSGQTSQRQNRVRDTAAKRPSDQGTREVPGALEEAHLPSLSVVRRTPGCHPQAPRPQGTLPTCPGRLRTVAEAEAPGGRGVSRGPGAGWARTEQRSAGWTPDFGGRFVQTPERTTARESFAR